MEVTETLGVGTASDPFDGSTATKLDFVLNNHGPANSHVHLGSGTFETNGYADGVSGGWQPKAGMKIEGSGIGVTTLRLVGTSQNVSYYEALSKPSQSVVAADVRRRIPGRWMILRSASLPRRLPLPGDFGRANSFRHGSRRREEADSRTTDDATVRLVTSSATTPR